MAELDDAKAYLSGSMSDTYADAVISAALEAERKDQQARVRPGLVVNPQTNPALREALFRRVARNLAMRAVPLGIAQADESAVRIGSRDPEVRRLEAPYRRLSVG